MKRIVAGLASMAVVLTGFVGLASTASASTTYIYNGSFTMNDGVASETATITVSNLKATDGSLVSGDVSVRMDVSGSAACTLHLTSLSGSRANVGLGGCAGWIDFGGIGTPSLTVADVWLHHDFSPLLLFTGAASGTAAGVAQAPTVVPLTGCSASLDESGQTVNFDLSGSNPDATHYELVINAGPALPPGLGDIQPGVQIEVPYSLLNSGTPYTGTITATRADGQKVAECTTSSVTPWLPPGKPTIDSVVAAIGGLLTVNYSVADPATVLGIEYSLDGGAWSRPGGSAPINGAGGAFTVSNIATGKHTVTLRSVGFDPKPMTTDSASTNVTIPEAPKKPGGSAAKPSQGTAPSASASPAPSTSAGTSTPSTVYAAGSSATKPVALPPAQPVSKVAGTSNGAGVGTNGALAANTGEAGIDAPCLAADGTLYPNQYSTVGSQLTMAPNTKGMGEPKSFSVVSGALAPGVMLDRTYGVLYGVTTQEGSWVTTIQATFADGSTKSSQFTTRVDGDPETLQYAALNLGIVGQPTSIAPTTNAPATGTTYRLVCGKLPPGTKLNPRTGEISGTPTKTDFLPTPLRIAETSATGKSAASFIFIVDSEGRTTLSYPAHPHLRAHKMARIRPSVHGVGVVAEFRMWKGKLPKGLRLNRLTGEITGKPVSAGKPHTIRIHGVTSHGALLTSGPIVISVRR